MTSRLSDVPKNPASQSGPVAEAEAALQRKKGRWLSSDGPCSALAREEGAARETSPV